MDTWAAVLIVLSVATCVTIAVVTAEFVIRRRCRKRNRLDARAITDRLFHG